MSGTRIGMAMSGGVDSTVSATLLREQGYQVEGFFMLLPVAGLEGQIRRVRHLAGQLRIPLHLVDLRQEFGQVIRYFVDSYRQGLTPNPCIRCNPEIKFGALFAAMQKHNMEQMATGHYARVLRAGDGSAALYRGLAPGKDQSYFLCRLPAGLLERIVLPLGEWHKTEVYERAARLGLTGFDGQESQDVCFLDQGLSAFLRRQGMTDSEGEIVSSDGRVLGRHRGIWHYTVGQRRGLGLPDATPWYVLGLDGRRNRVIVGKNDELFSATVMVRDLHWLAPAALPWQGLVQLRSRHRAAPARLEQAGSGGWRICFDTPQRAITPGQFAVLYQDDRLVASAVITGPGHPERDTTDT